MDYRLYNFSVNKKFIFFLRFLFLLSIFFFYFKYLKIASGDLIFLVLLSFIPFSFLFYKENVLMKKHFSKAIFTFDTVVFLLPGILKNVNCLKILIPCWVIFFTAFLISNFKKGLLLYLTIPLLIYMEANTNIQFDLILIASSAVILLTSILYGSFLGQGANELIKSIKEKDDLIKNFKKIFDKIEEQHGTLTIKNFATKIFETFKFFFKDAEVTIYAIENNICKVIESTNIREINNEFELEYSQNIKRVLEDGRVFYEKGELLDKKNMTFIYMPILHGNNSINLIARVVEKEENFTPSKKELLKVLFKLTSSYSKVVFNFEETSKEKESYREKLMEISESGFTFRYLGEFIHNSNTGKSKKELLFNLYQIVQKHFKNCNLIAFKYDSQILSLIFDTSFPHELENDFKNLVIKEENKLWESLIKDKILIFGDLMELDTTINRTIFYSNGIKSIIVIPYNLNFNNQKGIILLCFKENYDFKKEDLFLLVELKKAFESLLKSLILPYTFEKHGKLLNLEGEVILNLLQMDLLDFISKIKEEIKEILNLDFSEFFFVKENDIKPAFLQSFNDQEVFEELKEITLKKKRKIKRKIDKYTGENLFQLLIPVKQDEVYGVYYFKGYIEDISREELNFIEFLANLTAIKIVSEKTPAIKKIQEKRENLTDFLSRLSEEIKLMDQKKYSLGIVNICALSKINREYGFERGNNLIQITKKILEKHIPSRIGEIYDLHRGIFLIFLRNMNLAGAVKLCKKLLLEVETDFPLLKLNIGLASFPRHGEDISQIYFSAEESLNRARSKGENNIFFPPEETFIYGTEKKSVNFESEIEKILGDEKTTGPHTIEELNEFIEALIKKKLKLEEIGIILHRLVLRVDYPDNEGENYNFVPELSLLIGKKAGLSRQQLAVLKFAALFYDIGKFYIKGEILYAPRQLKEEEKKNVVEHVNVGVVEILMPHKIFNPILKTIKFHHENWDGSGYPWQLKGDEIPIESRILFLVDSFKALVTNRPYRKRSAIFDALKIINSLKNKHFDPKLVEILNGIYGYNEKIS